MTVLRDELQRTLGEAYTLERELGGGGMSTVFVARDNALGRSVVVKVLPYELAATVSVDRFKREIMLSAALQHPHIVPVLSAGETGGDDKGAATMRLPFFIMPFVEGESLRARLSRGPLSVREAVSILKDVARALVYAHGRGIIHRDIKPDNILLSGGSATVTDFGVAKAHLGVARGSQAASRRRAAAPSRSSARRSARRRTWRPSRRPAIRTPITAPISTRSASSATRCSSARRRSTAARRSNCSPRS